jgi:excisionase family DNA binding protein
MAGHDTPLPTDWLSVSEAAAVMGVSDTTVRNWLRDGILEGRAIQLKERQRWLVAGPSVMRLKEQLGLTGDGAGPGLKAPRAQSGSRMSVDEALEVIRDVATGDESEAGRLRARVARLEVARLRERDVEERLVAVSRNQEQTIRLLTEALAIRQQSIDELLAEDTMAGLTD